jgi:hypothetical protein
MKKAYLVLLALMFLVSFGLVSCDTGGDDKAAPVDTVIDYRVDNSLGLTNTYDGALVVTWEGTCSSAVGADGEIVVTIDEIKDWGEYAGGFSVIQNDVADVDLSGVDYIYFEFTSSSAETDPAAYQYQLQGADEIIVDLDSISVDGATGLTNTTLACVVDVSLVSSSPVPIAMLFPATAAVGDTLTFSNIAFLADDGGTISVVEF